MKKLIQFVFGLTAAFSVSAQCDITTTATSYNLVCGESATLSAFGSGSGISILNENFNTGGYGPGWNSSPGSTDFSNPCTPNGVDGTPYAWMGSTTAVPRTLTSQSYNLTAATNGVSVCFDLNYAIQGQNAPCEGPDLPDEGITLQYSIDGGATWVDIHYFDPNGGNDPQLTNWNNWCFDLPPAAITANTIIRWSQLVDSGADYDHWGIDNVQIFQNDINAEIVWLHDGYSYGVGNSGGANPNVVSPTSTTTYTAQITTSTGQVCTSTVTINVLIPTYEVNLTANPTTLCPGDCATISGTAEIVIHPESDENFENIDVVNFTSTAAFIVPGEIDVVSDINVQNLYSNTLNTNSINSVCITNFKFTDPGGLLCSGNQTANLSLIEIVLTSPDGTEVVLAPIGSMSGTEINNMCFELGAAALPASSPIYTGTYAPANSWAGLTGNANGIWKLTFRGQHNVGPLPGCLPQGTFIGWDLNIKDPKVTQPVSVVWSPTDGLSSTNTANTTACPTYSTNYNLFIGNGNPACPTYTQDFPIIVNPCNGCTPPVASVSQPADFCGPTNYDLSTAVTLGGSATVTYHAVNTDAANDVNPLPSSIVTTSGNYFARIEDPTDPTCYTILPIGVTINALPNVNAGNDTTICTGSVANLAASGAFNYSWNNGVVNGQNFFPSATTTYTVTGTSAEGCTATDQVTVTVSSNITVNAGPDQSICAGNPVLLYGSGAETYTWDNGVVDGQAFTPAGTNTYIVTGTSLTGCTGTDAVTVTVNPGITVDAGTDQSICNGQSVTLSASGATTYTWDNGVTNGTAFTPTSTTTYTVTGTANGCTATDQVTVTVNPNTPVNAGTDVVVCAGQSVTLNATGTPTISWNNGVTNGTSFVPSTTTTYTVSGTSANGCVTSDDVLVTVNPLPTINAGTDQTICIGNSVLLNGSGGVNYTWSNGVTNNTSVSPTSTTTYTVTGTDANGCINTSSVTVTVVPVPTADVSADVTIGNSPLNVTFSNNSSNAANYTWEFGFGTPLNVSNTNDQNITYNSGGTYEVILTASNGGCFDKDTIYITVLPTPPPSIETPNVFTPNNDGENDVYFLPYTNLESIEVLILNRWGNVMYEYKNLNGFWDGKVNGKEAEEGVYFYKFIAKALNGEELTGHGFFHLER